MHNLDKIVQSYFLENRMESGVEFFYIITKFFDFSLYFILLYLFVSWFVFLRKGERYAGLFIFVNGLGSISVYALKSFFSIARPVGGVIDAFSSSFPSFHATQSTVFFLMLIYIFREKLDGFSKFLLYFISMLMILLVSFSRIYLGVHWLSDVLFGVLLGGFISFASVKVFQRFTPK